MQFDESHIKNLRQSGCCVTDYDAVRWTDEISGLWEHPLEEAKLAAIAAGETVQVYKVNWQGQEKRQGHTDQGAEQGAEANWCHLHELLKSFSKHNFSHSFFTSVNGQLGCFLGL